MGTQGRLTAALARTVFVVVAGLLAAKDAAGSEDHRRVVAFVDPANIAFLSLLRVEMESSGFDLRVVDLPSWPPTASDTERIAREEGAIASLSLGGDGPDVGIVILDRITGRTVFREIITRQEHPDAADVVAVRVVESLRAALEQIALPLSSPPGPGDVPVRPLPPTTRTTAGTRSRLSVALRGGAAFSPGGLAIASELGAEVRWDVTSRVYVSLDALLTPAAVELSAPEGRARLAFYLAGPSLGTSLTDGAGPWQIRIGGGGWMSLMTMAGSATSPYVSADANVTSLILHADVSARLAVTPHIGLAAGVSVGASFPEVAIQFADRQVATWGRPLTLGFLAFESTLD